jgi:hypothetical protein
LFLLDKNLFDEDGIEQAKQLIVKMKAPEHGPTESSSDTDTTDSGSSSEETEHSDVRHKNQPRWS